jgi:sulfate adenylyltransferase subunit 2
MKNQDSLMAFLDSQERLHKVWSPKSLSLSLFGEVTEASAKATDRLLNKFGLNFKSIDEASLKDEQGRGAVCSVVNSTIVNAKKRRNLVLFVQRFEIEGRLFLGLNDGRGGRRWIRLEDDTTKTLELVLANLLDFEEKSLYLLPDGELVSAFRHLCRQAGTNTLNQSTKKSLRIGLEVFSHSPKEIHLTADQSQKHKKSNHLTHLDRLEAEAIHIIREVMSEAKNPVMLYSVGKDSSVMLHLARKAFYPSTPPFPLLHVDTQWKFKAMYDFRDYMAKESGMELNVHINPEGIEKDINPLDHGSALHTDIMKTQGLKQALDLYKYDVAFGGARRDEEKSRAKERVFSFRNSAHRWDPKNQRPELWNLYNGRKKDDESIRVFPISNWTELDIWQYIYREQIPIVPLYFAAERAVVERDGMLILVDDERLKIYPEEKIQIKKVRFRTLGCYPLTGAIESEADDLPSIVLELLSTKTSERQGRAIDSDSSASMEKKKQEGYF